MIADFLLYVRMIGHGSNSCARSTTTGAASDNSTRPEWAVETGSGTVSVVQDQRMDDSDPPPACPLPESLENETPESDYGPWLLVSRRRGGTRGRGGGARASRVTQGCAESQS